MQTLAKVREPQGVGGSEQDPPAAPLSRQQGSPPPQEPVPSLQSPTPPFAGPQTQRISRTRLQKPDHKKARALKMLEKRILEGKSTAQIATEFGVSHATAQRAMSFAAKGDLIVSFEDTLLRDLVPLAQTAAKMALMEGNAKVALEVLKGVGLLRSTHTRTQTQVAEEDALSRYIAQKRVQSQQLEDTHDGELAHPAALPPAAAGPNAPPPVGAAESGRHDPTPAPGAGPDPDSAVETGADSGPRPTRDGGLDV